MTKDERNRIRLNLLLTKPGDLTPGEKVWVEHLKREING